VKETTVDRSSSLKSLGKVALQQIPALLIGRLATDTRTAGLGLGTEMVQHILATAVELNIEGSLPSSGCYRAKRWRIPLVATVRIRSI